MPTTDVSALSLHDALPIYAYTLVENLQSGEKYRWYIRIDLNTIRIKNVDALSTKKHLAVFSLEVSPRFKLDRKSTRLNSSHLGISYAVFCLKKKMRGNYSP